jgi:hypothetical protein
VAVDVVTETVIQRPREDVAAYAGDPDNAPEWYVNIKSIEWESEPPLALGSKLAFVASFMGKRLAYTYEVVELEPGAKMVMRTAEGPFPMETSYVWEDAGEGATKMTLRNRGQPTGFAKLTAPLMVRAMRSANEKDLASIKRILESR